MPERTTTLIALLLSLALAGCDAGAAGRRAYGEGRFEDAHAAFAAATDSEGDGASAELLYNRGLAALRAGDLRDADASATKAASRGGAESVALAVFLRGNAAFALSGLAERQADTVEAEPFAFDIAIEYARAARNHWQRAAVTRDDWPEARRNVERAIRKIEELVGKKREAAARRERRPEALPDPVRKPGVEQRPTEEESPIDPQLAELSSEDVLKLIERLAEKEREKVALRRSHRRKLMEEVEKDW